MRKIGGCLGATVVLFVALRVTPAQSEPLPAAPPSYPAPATAPAAASPPVAGAPAASAPATSAPVTPAPAPQAAAPSPVVGPGYPPVASPGYPPPSSGGYPSPYWQAPETLPYREGSPIPAGYRVQSQVRSGLVLAGALTLGIPYLIGLSAVSTHDSNNGANWLLVPAIGPWLAIAARRNVCTYSSRTGMINDPVGCTTDAFTVTGLVFDGIVQTAGATLLIIGFALPKKVLVRQDLVKISFTQVASGSGITASGSF